MRNQLLAGLFAATSLLSCKKDTATTSCTHDCVTLTGRVTTTPGGQPIGGATVRVATMAGADSQELGQAQTDADGRYSLTFSQHFGGFGPAVLLHALHPDYISNEVGTDEIKFLTGSDSTATLTEDIHLYRKANLQVHLTTQGYGNGAILMTDVRFGAPGPGTVNLAAYISMSHALDTTFTLKTAADVPVSVAFDAAGRSFRDTVTIPAGTTRLLQVAL
ncbi:peptidase associated/transthyretin-like domain-containing protein [Flaviaesturariibacter terrae]